MNWTFALGVVGALGGPLGVIVGGLIGFILDIFVIDVYWRSK